MSNDTMKVNVENGFTFGMNFVWVFAPPSFSQC
jgi:hypothetical protein